MGHVGWEGAGGILKLSELNQFCAASSTQQYDLLLCCEWNTSLFKGYLHRTYILRWKNDKRVKEQRLLFKGVMPCGEVGSERLIPHWVQRKVTYSL